MQNITELRQSLGENYEELKAGKMDIKMAKELANTAGKMINTVKVELEYKKMTRSKKSIPFLEK
mgnify:CR=1 FL=1